MVTSGLRIDTPVLATRGSGPDDFAEVADVIALALRPSPEPGGAAELRARVEALTARHAPLSQSTPARPAPPGTDL